MTEYHLPLAAFTPEEIDAWQSLETEWLALLQRRKAEMGIPAIGYQPTDDDLMVFRFSAREQKTEGGLILPSFVMTKDQDQYTGQTRTIAEDKVLNIGLLLEAGLSARDFLRSHGYLIGDIVKWGRFSGQEENAHWFSGGKVASLEDVLLLNVRDLRGSFDLDLRLNGEPPRVRRVFVADGEGRGLHVIKPIPGKENT